ncbi:MAG: hypothetical protein UT69_C0037G0008 [Candidatus Yanofskybacteria bacterium GW2011_GWE1_40_10]|nr:MAG: hypothetical protein UT69_C0037G0008 [Candidatus Yanofskybacteria bacterium GW2011_GWE1_40_10]
MQVELNVSGLELDVDEMLKELLAKNPALLASELRELQPSSAVQQERKQHRRPKGQVDHILTTHTVCLLCETISSDSRRLTWDYSNGLFRSSIVPPVLPEVLPVELQYSETLTCNHCKDVLQKLEKQALVELLILGTDPLQVEARESRLRKTLKGFKEPHCR